MWRTASTMIWILVTSAVISWLILVLLAQFGLLFDGYSSPLIVALLVTASVAFIARRLRLRESFVRRSGAAKTGLVYWASIATFIAVAPFLSSVASKLIAVSLGCTVNEHFAQGCSLGPWDLNAFVHTLHLFIFALIFTWPAALAALVLWATIVFGSSDRGR